MLWNSLKRLRRDESGAVTVDWVVLTGAILVFGMLVLGAVADGATDVSTGIGAQLSAAPAPIISFQ